MAPKAQPVSVALGRALREARGARPQSDIAELVDVEQPTISRWEKGETTPSVEQLIRLEDGLGIARGTLMRAGNLLGEYLSVEECIASDLTLTEDYRSMVLTVYREAVALSSSGRTSRNIARATSSRKRSK